MKRKNCNCVIVSLFTIFFISLLLFLSYSILILIPASISTTFGEPNEDIDQAYGLFLAVRLFLKKETLNSQYKGNHTVEFEISSGDSAVDVSSRLSNLSIIEDEEAFLNLLVYSGKDLWILPGKYFVEPGMNAVDVMKLITNEDPDVVNFSFLPGWRWEEIAELLPSSGLNISQEEFGEIILNEENPIAMDKMGLEGLLFPGEFQFLRSDTADTIVNQIIESFQKSLPQDFSASSANLGLEPYEVIILASIVQREMIDPDEAEIIASVFHNRLAHNMLLQSDPTVQYALGFQQDSKTWWKSPLSNKDLEIESAFNTYLHMGLPPAPICNPGLDAILAVLHPTDSDFLFFRADCNNPDRHLFSVSYEAHILNACK